MKAVLQLQPQLKTYHIEASGKELASSVVTWFRAYGRDFPWRSTKNPFHILIAEVLLRQTQARRVKGTYIHLVTTYPDPASLAQAGVESLREWFGLLGLVRRADRLVECARRLVRDYEGLVPHNLEDLESLPGIGKYSARAILCMAFGDPVPMIDEGSGRVLRRVLGLPSRGPAYSDETLAESAERLLPHRHAKEFNLGLIDIGAAYCHPRGPDCRCCPLLSHCAFGSGLAASTVDDRKVCHDDE